MKDSKRSGASPFRSEPEPSDIIRILWIPDDESPGASLEKGVVFQMHLEHVIRAHPVPEFDETGSLRSRGRFIPKSVVVSGRGWSVVDVDQNRWVFDAPGLGYMMLEDPGNGTDVNLKDPPRKG